MCPWHPQLLHWFLGSTHATVRICNWTQRGQLTLGMFLPCMKWMQKLSNWNALIYIFVTYTFISFICLWEMKMRYVSLQVAFLFDVFIVTMWFLVPLYVAYRIFSHLLFNIIFVLVHVVSRKKRKKWEQNKLQMRRYNSQDLCLISPWQNQAFGVLLHLSSSQTSLWSIFTNGCKDFSSI